MSIEVAREIYNENKPTCDSINDFAEHYKYRKLPTELARLLHDYYYMIVPSYLYKAGDQQTLYTSAKTPITDGYLRVVIGDYGPFIEFTMDQANKHSHNFRVKEGQEYRVTDPRYKDKVKYLWYTAKDDSDIKVYLQKLPVTYADYIPGRLYVSVFEAYTEDQF